MTETEHEFVDPFTVHSTEGSLTLHEYKCGAKYVVTGTDANYCPRCGDEL